MAQSVGDMDVATLCAASDTAAAVLDALNRQADEAYAEWSKVCADATPADPRWQTATVRWNVAMGRALGAGDVLAALSDLRRRQPHHGLAEAACRRCGGPTRTARRLCADCAEDLS